MGDIQQQIRDLVVESLAEFLAANDPIAHYSPAGDHVKPKTSEESYASVIGYSGMEMSGSLAIQCERKMLDLSHPNHSMGMPVEVSDLTDWAGEIANQVLGRIKNKLASAGVKLAMGTPTTVKGNNIEITPHKDGFYIPLTFVGKAENLSVFFHAVTDQNLKLNIKDQVKTATVQEGDGFLF